MNQLQLPSLNSPITIDPSMVSSFRKNGHVLIEGVLQPFEVEAYREAINEAAYKYNTEKRKMSERDTYGKAFLQVMNLWEVDELVKKFTLAKRFAKIAADLLGVENVRLYHDQALYKEPGGGFTPWHQDQYYWPLSTTNTVTMWMPLIDITEDLGMLTFASGSHKEGSVENIGISDESEMLLEQFIKNKNYPVSRQQSMRAGDASWHYGWTLHSAPGNLSNDITREVMTLIYFADGATVTEPINENQEADRQRWLCGIKPGNTASSDLNPLLL